MAVDTRALHGVYPSEGRRDLSFKFHVPLFTIFTKIPYDVQFKLTLQVDADVVFICVVLIY